MARTLVLFAHPALEKSRVHRGLLPWVPDHPDLTFHDLYEVYPRLDVDVAREQALLEAHEVVVFQFPLYWYSTPPLLKQWQDLVLEHGWAYGSDGTALRGKVASVVASAGGTRDAYCAEGHNRFSVRQLLAPLEQTCLLCGMRYLPPWVVFGTHRLGGDTIEHHGEAYGRYLRALVESGPPGEEVDGLQELHPEPGVTVGLQPTLEGGGAEGSSGGDGEAGAAP